MTIETLKFQEKYVGNGVATVFPYVVNYIDDDNIKVYLDEVRQLTGYQVIKNPDTAEDMLETIGIEFDTAPPQDTNIHIIRSTPKLQNMDFVDGAKLRAASLEHGFDNVVMMMQELVAGEKGDPGPVGPAFNASAVDNYDGDKTYQNNNACIFNGTMYWSKSNNNTNNNPETNPLHWSLDRKLEAKAVALTDMANGLAHNMLAYGDNNEPKYVPFTIDPRQKWYSYETGTGLERESSVSYTNSTPNILVVIIAKTATSTNINMVSDIAMNNERSRTFVVMPGDTYQGSGSLGVWLELRILKDEEV